MITHDELISLLQRVDDEFDNLSRLDSPESVTPNEKLWNDIQNTIDMIKILKKKHEQWS